MTRQSSNFQKSKRSLISWLTQISPVNESKPIMIVRSVDAGWTVVFHSSHGLLAQRLASHLDVEREFPFWFETQVAIGLHDDVHRVYAAGKCERLTMAGAPRDFTLVPMTAETRVSEMQTRIDDAYRKHSWLGVMQSKHAECLYCGEDTSSDMQQMLDTESERRETILKRLGIAAATVQRTYDWMHFCDRLSLILCGNDVPAMNRSLEITTDSEGSRSEIWQDEHERTRISPWPFLTETIELSIEQRTLKQLSLVDDAELGESLRAYQVELRIFNIFKN